MPGPDYKLVDPLSRRDQFGKLQKRVAIGAAVVARGLRPGGAGLVGRGIAGPAVKGVSKLRQLESLRGDVEFAAGSERLAGLAIEIECAEAKNGRWGLLRHGYLGAF